MSVTDTTSSLSLKDILANSSIKTNTSADGLAAATNSATGKKALGKDAFLQLLVTQLKNQNPLEPQDNGEFVAQLAQFSSLEGITTLNDTVSGLASNYNSSQALQASSLVGRSVIAPSDKSVVDTSKSFSGTIAVPASVDPSRSRSPMPMARLSAPSTWAARKPVLPVSSGMAKTTQAKWPRRVPIPSALRRPTTARRPRW